MLRERDGRLPCPHDSGLFGSDCGDGVAQELLVIEIDVGDHGKQGFDDVGRVKAAAHADLKDRYVEFEPHEAFEGDCGHGLEETWMPRQLPFRNEPLCDPMHMGVGGGEEFICDWLTVNTNAFVDPDEVG